MIRILLLVAFTCSFSISQTTPTNASKLRVSVTSSKHTYRLGEPVRVKYELGNVGETSFYIPKGIDPVSDARGCVILDVSAEHGGEGIVEKHYADQATEYWQTRDIRAEVRTDWLLLKPGQVYGMTTTLKFTPLKEGRYWIIATHASGHLSDKEKSELVNQDYPLLFGTHSSKPIEIEVVKAGGRFRSQAHKP
jgi:hypothetical protein